MKHSFEKIPLAYHVIEAVNKGMTSGQKLMIVLHGRGDTLDSYKTFTREINVTGLNYLLLNAPFTEFFGYTWYDDSFDFNDVKYKKSMELLKNTVATVTKETSFKEEDLFLMGFSQGGRMVLDLFLELNTKLSGVVALSPRVSQHRPFPELSEAARQTPLFLAHGLYDPVIPFDETKGSSASWQSSVKESEFHSYEMGHEVDIMEIQDMRAWLNNYL